MTDEVAVGSSKVAIGLHLHGAWPGVFGCRCGRWASVGCHPHTNSLLLMRLRLPHSHSSDLPGEPELPSFVRAQGGNDI